MIYQRVRGLRFLHCLLQAGATVVYFWIWALLVFVPWGIPKEFLFQRYAVYSLLAGAAFLFDFARTRTTTTRDTLVRLQPAQNHQVTLRQTFTVFGSLALFLVAAKDQHISRLFLFSLAPCLYGLLFGMNAYVPKFLAQRFFNGKRLSDTILIGSSTSALRLKQWLQRKNDYGLRMIGLVTDEKETSANTDLPTLGTPAEIESVLEKSGAAQLILIELPDQFRELDRIVEVCERLGVRLMIINDLPSKLNRTVSFSEDDGVHIIGFRQEPLECPVNRLVKRLIDICISLPVVALILPWVTLGVWVFQRAQSPGPLFFRQRRTGLQNREFLIFKFRTMHMNHGREAQQATNDDPRVFAAGRWMRSHSIDELPQFINVLKGEMSIVGPRPHFIEHSALFTKIAGHYRMRGFIKPGITGLAQVDGLRGETRGNDDLLKRVESDLYYLEHWSPLLDWHIIFRTAWQLLVPPRNAY
jgi:exopolysaccharide biosynthesis polyprenyl glycosylphosphotransferase